MKKPMLFGTTKRKLAPKICPDCKGKLSAPKYGNAEVPSDKVIYWYVECECGVVLKWSWREIWKRYHKAGPLFN